MVGFLWLDYLLEVILMIFKLFFDFRVVGNLWGC